MDLFVIKTIHLDNESIWCSATDFISDSALECCDVIANNYGDLCEDGFNQYAMIGKTETGLYPFVEELRWYKWNTDKYIECKRPDFLKHWAFSL